MKEKSTLKDVANNYLTHTSRRKSDNINCTCCNNSNITNPGSSNNHNDTGGEWIIPEK